MEPFEGAECRPRAGRKRDAAPIALFRTAVGLTLLLAAVLAGLVGCAPPSGPTLVAPSVLHVSRDPGSSTELHIEEDRAAGVAFTFDAGDPPYGAADEPVVSRPVGGAPGMVSAPQVRLRVATGTHG